MVTIVLLFISVVCISMFYIKKTSTYTYEKTGEILYNPMMGFAPVADYVEAVGDNTLVYLPVTWRELEPEEGQYDFDSINEQYQLERWKSLGKQVVFRFVCDNPSDEKHMDIPDWLYEKTGDGFFYDGDYGKGYSPDYTNETFIGYHEKALEALGKEYGQDSFFYFIELGSLGHWGEWHVKYDEGIRRFPSEAVCLEYVRPYLKAFPNARLLMRRPFSFVKDYKMGVFNDMTGDAEDTAAWLSWIQQGGLYEEAEEPMALLAVPDIWKTQPVGGEFSSGMAMEDYLTGSLSQTIKLLKQTHMSFIGPQCPIANKEFKEYPEEVKQVLEHVGYRYRIPGVRLEYNRLTKNLSVKFVIENNGAAPIYEKWPLFLYVLDEAGEVKGRYETNADLSSLLDGDSQKICITLPLTLQNDAFPELAVGIENPATGTPAVALDMKTRVENGYYYLNEN